MNQLTFGNVFVCNTVILLFVVAAPLYASDGPMHSTPSGNFASLFLIAMTIEAMNFLSTKI